MGGAHARLSPSDSARWLNCPGSIEFTKDYPPTSTEAADEGTAAHWVREQCLELGFDPYDFIGTQIHVNGKLYTCDDEMADALAPGIDEIREFDGEMYVEEWVDLTKWVGLDKNGKRQGGTIDCGVAGKELHVLSDEKYGKGVPVDAVRNSQQMLYALGFWDQIARHISDAEQFLIIVDQPRNAAGGGYWSVSLSDLLKFGEEVKVRAELTLKPNAPLIPGRKQCAWCPAANLPGRQGGCPAHHADMLDLIGFEDLDAPEPWKPPVVESMTFERRLKVAEHMTGISQWLEYIHASVLQDLLDEGPKGGKKAVLGRNPPRKWRDQRAAEAFIRQKNILPFNQKLKTPKQIEKAIGRGYEIPQALVERGSPKPIIVPAEDARDAIRPLGAEFEDLGSEFDDL
jgi:hypothetical protein